MYTRAVLICQSVMTAIYVTLGIVVYYYCGSYVSSPALGSAGTTMKKVCYGIALPGLTVTMTLFIHVTCFFFTLKIAVILTPAPVYRKIPVDAVPTGY